ncbi:MAG: hypothetical protein ACKOB6_06385 [Candidatus Kapaibacterium sp.]
MSGNPAPTIHVIFRACDKVNAVNNNPRPFMLDKTSLVAISFQSLLDSLRDVPHTVHVLGDKLSPALRAFFLKRGVQLIEGDFGNDESIRQALLLGAAVADDDWVYFCEDYYVHVPHAMRTIHRFFATPESWLEHPKRLYTWSSFIDLRKRDLVVHPTDYPDRYRGKYRRFSLILHSQDCHWRQITDTTFTFLLKASVLRKRLPFLLRCAKGANDRMLSRGLYGRLTFFGKALGVSPMPGLATHMHRDTMSPLTDWESIVDALRARLQEEGFLPREGHRA